MLNKRKIPCGVINWAEIVRECLFVDNTRYIRELEAIKTPVFLRQKRFGDHVEQGRHGRGHVHVQRARHVEGRVVVRRESDTSGDPDATAKIDISTGGFMLIIR